MAGEQVSTDGHVEWSGLLLGPGTRFDLISLTGWTGAPPSRRVTIDRPGRHGALPGELRASERIIEAEFAFGGFRTAADFTAARDDLAAALAWDENPVEAPLVVQVNGRPTMVMARVINADLPTPPAIYAGAREGSAAIQWAASDPRRYGLALRQESTGLPAAVGSGLAWALAWPLDWGPGLAGGTMVLINEGNTPAWPVWEITGPVTGPVITCQDTGAELAFRSDFVIAAGQTVRIDTDTGSVTLGAVNRRSELAAAEWFPVPPRGAPKTVRFTAVSGSGQLTGYVRDAWMT